MKPLNTEMVEAIVAFIEKGTDAPGSRLSWNKEEVRAAFTDMLRIGYRSGLQDAMGEIEALRGSFPDSPAGGALLQLAMRLGQLAKKSRDP